MLFNSINFLIFFPIVSILYFAIPKKAKNYWLLATSYFFYGCWDPRYIFLLLGTTIVTFIFSLLIQKFHEKKLQKLLCLCAVLVFNFGILFFFKYYDWIFTLIAKIFGYIHISLNFGKLNLTLPVGISFFTFQAVGYTIDVYRKEIYAERNFFKYALFVSFFPQLVAGPIERSKNLLKQLNETYSFDFKRIRDGLFTMLWGFFLKLVIADRAAILVDKVFENFRKYPGSSLLFATIIFAFQIYCDFAGYSTIAKGAGKVIGVNLMDNFASPYFSTSVKDFWRRWHISLSSWFRDYVYIPLGGSRCSKARKNLNVLAVMVLSGIWHGAGLSFIAWGALHGFFQIFDEITRNLREKISKWILVPFTFAEVCLAWIFFRAESLLDSLRIVKKIVFDFSLDEFFGNATNLYGLDISNIKVLFFSIMILLISDFFKSKNISIREKILESDIPVKISAFVAGTVFILVFGIWGNSYEVSNFIYFQF